MAGFHIENFGCRAARADGEAIANGLRSRGLTEKALDEVDLVIVNSCSVTAEADRDARAFVRKARRINPEVKVVVTGCYAQRAPEEAASIAGVDAVVGNSHKAFAAQIAFDLVSSAKQQQVPLLPASALVAANPQTIWVDDGFAHSWIEEAQILPGFGPGAQTRPNLKIQEGCSNRCTFCIIPTTRGNSRSMGAEKVLEQVRGFVVADGKEMVLSGINLGRWGRDLPENRSFASLVREILETTKLSRLRLSSIEPMDWTAELIALMREFAHESFSETSPRLARHAHLPLQSGSDAVLRRMHRRYRPWHYAQKVAELSEAAGDELGLGADVMVGFPGETHAEFQESHDFIAALPFSYLHIFRFSPRPGTRGWELHRQSPVPAQAVQERLAVLRALIREKSHRFRTSFVGKVLPAVTLNANENADASDGTSGIADNFLPLRIDQVLPPNRILPVLVRGIGSHGELLCEPAMKAFV
ncbi:MiaB/RimO family radical SAM methylthiotransferase [Acidicapsa dinghuensis]|uniref:MiaB/RimO family radical SAM methylthiotransferase n=1 Tax=Acidicapsa dinghuensis TaxID=2218256 RepID=A0ABW1EI35_9BACT|nr:MiaB/RimO family radical SAM methylthiotransferase [Acidicapsa dinghuensis]